MNGDQPDSTAGKYANSKNIFLFIGKIFAMLKLVLHKYVHGKGILLCKKKVTPLIYFIYLD